MIAGQSGDTVSDVKDNIHQNSGDPSNEQHSIVRHHCNAGLYKCLFTFLLKEQMS